jgi:integrase
MRSVRSVIDPKLDFSTAAKNWLAWHRSHISARTAGDYAQYIATLELFDIGAIPLTEIHPGHFEQYQVWRKTNPKRGAKNPRINQELNCLKQVLEQAGLWDAIKPFYKQLPMPKWKPPRVYTPEQEDEILRTLASNPNWQVAQCAITITDNSAIGPGELRAVLVEHLKLESSRVYVAAGELGDKNEFRIAPMALNKPAHAAFEVLLERYYLICKKQGIEPDGKHFLIPLREKKGTYDPRQQASPSFIRSALREVSAIVGYRVRHNSFRHQCLTSLLEIPEISEETVKAIARHKISERTIEHYSHIRIHKKQNALDMLHDRRRFEALRRPPQRENAKAAPLTPAVGFQDNPSYPQGN